jgi:hypothetical protein
VDRRRYDTGSTILADAVLACIAHPDLGIRDALTDQRRALHHRPIRHPAADPSVTICVFPKLQARLLFTVTTLAHVRNVRVARNLHRKTISMKNGTLRAVLVAALIGTSVLAGFAQAQGFPGGRGQGRGGTRNPSGNSDQADAAKRNTAASNPALSEPALALERELPSLRSDLLLDVMQTDAWIGFERSVRDAARAAHARQRRIVEQRQAVIVGGIDLPPGAAASSLQDLIDDDRNRADLLANVVNVLGALAKILDPRQVGMINRRVVQALRDPLGAG